MHELRDASPGDSAPHQAGDDAGESPESDDHDLLDREGPVEASARGSGGGEGGVLVATSTRSGGQAQDGGERREDRGSRRVGQEQNAGKTGPLAAELVGGLAAGH